MARELGGGGHSRLYCNSRKRGGAYTYIQSLPLSIVSILFTEVKQLRHARMVLGQFSTTAVSIER